MMARSSRSCSSMAPYYTTIETRRHREIRKGGSVSELRVSLVPAIRLLVCVSETKYSSFVERGANELQSKRKVGRSESARNRNGRQARNISKCESAAGAHNSNRIRHRHVRYVGRSGRSTDCGRQESKVSFEQSRSVVTNLRANPLHLQVIDCRHHARCRPVDGTLL